MFLDELKKRNVPSLKSRAEMLELLQWEEYGCLPKAPESLVWEAEPGVADNFCAGKATLEKLTFRVAVNGKDFAFPVYLAVPTAEGPHPFFVHINFRSDVPDRYMPTEELIDNGFAVLSFGYEDVTRDDGDFTSGLAGVLYENGKRAPHDAGKIALWAWAAMRCMDYAEHDERLDCTKSIVCGHSRLGKRHCSLLRWIPASRLATRTIPAVPVRRCSAAKKASSLTIFIGSFRSGSANRSGSMSAKRTRCRLTSTTYSRALRRAMYTWRLRRATTGQTPRPSF